MPSKKAVSKSERHLRLTWESLMRIGRKGAANPKYVLLFGRTYSRFRDWSHRNGFSLETELELLGKHIEPGTRLEKRKVSGEEYWLPDWYQVTETELFYAAEGQEIPEREWITNYEEVRWVSQDDLARRKKKFELTAYGKKRLNDRRKPLILVLDGEEKSAAAWADDPRCAVSDKVLKARKEKGWSDSDAILTPPRKQPGNL
jgi:hypothetical protein